MKKLALIALSALALGFASCKPEPEPTPTPIVKTELQLLVVDSANNTVQAALVEVYKTQADYEARNPDKYVQGIKYTDSFGRVLISSLEAIPYWFYVQGPDGKTNNKMGVYTTTLVKGKTNSVKVTLK